MQTTSGGERTEKRTCDIHGEYIARLEYIAFLDRSVATGCPECIREEEERSKARTEAVQRAIAANQKAREIAESERVFTDRGIPARYRNTTLENFIADTSSKQAVLSEIAEYVGNQQYVIENGVNLLLYGRSGTGKTRLATSIVKEWEGVGYYITAREYTRLIRSTYAPNSYTSEDDVVNRFAEYSILAIDEIGKQFDTANERYMLFDIIDKRYRELKPTVLISNMNLEDTQQFLGVATFERIRENGGKALLFDWESFR